MSFVLEMALVSAAAGDREDVERLIKRWENEIVDPLDGVIDRAYACEILAMAGATQGTVNCLRSGTTEPSTIVTFLEPHLYHSDSIRDTPEFKALLIELGQ